MIQCGAYAGRTMLFRSGAMGHRGEGDQHHLPTVAQRAEGNSHPVASVSIHSSLNGRTFLIENTPERHGLETGL